MYLKTQKFLVFGLSKSGCAAADFLLKGGAAVDIYDELNSERIEETYEKLVTCGARRIPKEELAQALERCDALVLSPGVPIDHPLAIECKKQGKAVLGEAELAARFFRSPIVAVTGTNGKTTTVSLLTETLRRGGLESFACGNIGAPMTEFCTREGVAVAEISSFQLETLNSLRPHIAVVLNVTEDHLNRHYTMENYLFLKAKLLKNLTETEYAILNYDDPNVRAFASNTKANVLYFSVRERVRGAYFFENALWLGKEKVMSASDLFDGSVHNVQNALAVLLAAKLLGVKTEVVVDALSSFQGVKHRLEEIGVFDGVRYIDDSKGTNVDATKKAIAAMDADTVVLLGGKSKGYDYQKLFEKEGMKRVKHAVLYGENRFELLDAARKNEFYRFTLCDRFDFAVRVAAMQAKAGDTVLLSPSSASFDEFSGYEERGDRFAEMVRTLHEGKDDATANEEERDNEDEEA